jgi:RNA polymerase sigma factor for flagellar operon FliA
VLDSLRNLDELGRADRRRVKQEAAARSATAGGGEALAAGDASQNRYSAAIIARIPIHSASTWDKNSMEDRPFDPASTDDTPEQLYGSAVIRKLLNETVGVLPPRYQQIINLYYDADMTMREIGKLLGVNESRVSQMHKSALAKMAATLTEQGLNSRALVAA